MRHRGRIGHRGFGQSSLSWALAAALMAVPAAAGAQQLVSPAYTFLKNVKDRDGGKVEEELNKPGTTIIQSRDENGETALHIVTKRRDLLWVRYMLGRGANVNAQDREGNTALLDAAQIGFSDGAAELLSLGATPDLANNRGETPLIIATQARDINTVRALLQYGADPRVQDHVAGLSAMDYATRDPRAAAILKVLQEAKPKPKKAVAGPSL